MGEPEERRPGRREQVSGRESQRRQRRDGGGACAAQNRKDQSEPECAALAEADDHHPERSGPRGDEEPEETRSGRDGDHEQRRPLAAETGGNDRNEQCRNELENAYECLERAGRSLGVALVLEDRRQPREAAVEDHRLQAEVRRERPGAGEVVKAEGLHVADDRPLPRGRRQPERGCDDRGHCEHRESGAPAVVEETLERHRRSGRGGGSQRERHREGTGQAAAVAREPDPDQRRHSRLRDRDCRAGEEGPGEEPGGAADPAQRGPDGGKRKTCRDELLDRDAADERGCERCKEAEAEQRQSREETRCGRGEPELGAYVLEQRRQAGEDRAEIRPEQDDCDEEEDPGRAARSWVCSD